MSCRTAALVLSWIGVGLLTQQVTADDSAPVKRAVDAASVARLPYPGTATPGSIAFSSDSKALTYLKAERPDSLSRVLWRVTLPDGEPTVIARPPGEGDTDTTVSQEEALRRERQRQRETGITQVVQASRADVRIVPLSGDLYLQRGSGPLQRLTENDQPEIDPKPSPDGSKVAFVRNHELIVIDVPSLKETPLSSGSSEGLSHGLAEFIAQEELDRQTGFWWSPDGTRIAYQETDERHIPLFTIAHQGDNPNQVETHRYPFAGAANAKVRLGVVSAAGGPTRWLDLTQNNPDGYLARVTWDGPQSLLVQTLSRDQRRLRLERIDVESNRSVLLLEEQNDAWINLHHDLHQIEETGELIWSTESSGTRQLELRDRAGNRVRSLTSDPWPVDSVVAVDAKRREVWYAASGPNPTESHLFRVGLDGVPSVQITRNPGTHKAVVASNGSFYVDTASDLRTPPRTALWDREGRLLKTLDDAGHDPRLKELELTPPELVTFPTRDGVTLHGAYYAPKGRQTGEKAPLIVMVYGGPHVQTVIQAWTMTADLNAQYLTARGFAVWKCDNRGSSRRGHDFETPLYRRMGTIEVQDQVDGVRFITSQKPEIDPNRVGITGGSYGGYMTLRCLEFAPEVFHAGVALAPVTDWSGYDTAYTERYMSTPQDNPEGYKDSSVLTHVDKIAGNLLVIHGLIDENVHFRHSARLATALMNSGKAFELLPVPEERHSTRKPQSLKYLAERRANFFEAALAQPRSE